MTKCGSQELQPLSLVLGNPDDQVIKDARKIAEPSTPAEYKVFGHGNTYSIEGLNADQVATLIKKDPEYIVGEQIVVLYSCDTGKRSDGFARQLAENLGVTVAAPNRLLYPDVTNNDFLIVDPVSWRKKGCNIPYLLYKKKEGSNKNVYL